MSAQANSVLRRGMFAAAVLLLLAVVCAAPAAASADDAVMFGGGTFASASELETALGSENATVSGNTLTLQNDINVTGTIKITGDMTILGNGHTIWRGGNNFHLINVSNGTLTLGDNSSQLTIHGQNDKFFKDNTNGSIMVFGESAKLVMKDQVTLKNTTLTGNVFPSTGRGAGVTAYDGAVFEMQGGLITNNTMGEGRGAVNVVNNINDTKKTTFIMSGGEISYNTAMSYSSGLMVRGEFVMSGGKISYNTPHPGGWAHQYSRTLVYSGCDLSQIIAGGGGGVYQASGTFNITGGKISCNTAKGSGGGGGVYQAGDTMLAISGGEISHNIASGDGGGIKNYGMATLSGGKISYNKAIGTKSKGGGIYTEVSASFTMTGGEISHNSANVDGGGICTLNSLTITGGEISGNTAGDSGGGIDVWYKMVRISNATISDNIASGDGGGIIVGKTTYRNGDSFVYLSGHTIIRNNTAKNGGGIYIQRQRTGDKSSLDINNTVLIQGNTANTNGGGLYMTYATNLNLTDSISFKENTDNTGGSAIYLGGTDPSQNVRLSGAVTFDENQKFSLAVPLTNGIQIDKPYTGKIKSFILGSDSLDGKTIFTVDASAGTASSILPRLGLADTTKWTLAADDSAGKITGTLNKPVALSGADNVKVEWINSTIANISIRLDPNANDATDVSVKLGSQTSQTIRGTFPKGSTISDLQVTGLTAGTSYNVVAVLKNTGISTNEFTSDTLLSVTGPTPSTVKITGEGGAELPKSGVLLPQSKSMTFGVLVYDKDGNLLKDEPVTWSGVGTYTTQSASTATTITLTGGNSDGTDTLTATAVHGGASGTASINVTTTTPTSLSIKADEQTIALGDTVHLTAVATDAGNKQFAGYDVTWAVSPAGTIPAGKTGAAVSFTPTQAGAYTITATVADLSLTATTTITIVGKPAISGNPTDAAYTKGQTGITALTVSATAPGSGTLGYQWQKSTDPAFAADVTAISGATQTTCTPDVTTAGTWYYRANVTYTENGFTTWAHSNPAKITVLEPTADKITLTPGDATITVKKGSNTQITATAVNTTLNQELTGVPIVWAVENGGTFVSISQSDRTVTITGSAAGTAVITASSGKTEKKVTVIVNDPAATTHPITAGAGTGGSISPSGTVPVVEGKNQGFDITPDTGYSIKDVKVDGTSVGAVTYYTFDNVQKEHTIQAEFKGEASVTITATAGAGGSITPSGAVSVTFGTDKTFTITPSGGYRIADVTVDGTSVGAVGSYTFKSISAAHTIAATFTEAPRPPTPSGGGSSGDGYSSSGSSSVSATGQATFGTTTGITAISFAKGTTGTVIVDTKPTGITAPANCYAVYDITAPSFEGYAQIEFSVPVAIITDNGYTVNDIAIQHYTGGKWVRLDTTFLGEDRGAAHYIAATRSFSPFAITYEKGGAPTIEKATPEPTTKQTGSSTTAPTPAGTKPVSAPATPTSATSTAGDVTAQPTLTQAPAPMFGALAGLLAAGVLLRRKD